MISGIMHKGSGLGNQLHRYVMARVLAEDKGYDFSMVAPELFKGKDFMTLDMGLPNNAQYEIEIPSGRVVPSHKLVWMEWNKYCYDPDINFIKNNTIIDGNFEDERYFEHRLADIENWLVTEHLPVPDNLCIIGFRGGEYYTVPELGLPKEYFERAIKRMLEFNPDMKFEVHTDDPGLARAFFPNYPIVQDIGINWRSVRYAKHAIIANSSFYVLPRLLRGGITIAPRWWNRYNLQRWDYPQNFYKSFLYI